MFYSAVDSNPALGINYYRIATHDYDGKIYYTEIKELDFSNYSIQTIPFTVYPNPIFGNANLNLWVSDEDDFLIEIWDINGKLVWSKYDEKPKEPSIYEIPTDNWSYGIYILKYKNSTSEFFQKIVKY